MYVCSADTSKVAVNLFFSREAKAMGMPKTQRTISKTRFPQQYVFDNLVSFPGSSAFAA